MTDIIIVIFFHPITPGDKQYNIFHTNTKRGMGVWSLFFFKYVLKCAWEISIIQEIIIKVNIRGVDVIQVHVVQVHIQLIQTLNKSRSGQIINIQP